MIRKESEDILGYPVTRKDRESCVNEVVGWIRSREAGRYLVCANPHSLVTAGTDKVFGQALRNADLAAPDGVGIALASWILGGQIRRRVTGSDIFLGVNERLDRIGGYRCCFLGSTEETLGRIARRMRTAFPHVEVAGTLSPPFRKEFNEDDDRVMTEAINAAGAHLLWVGMTAPKQEKWIFLNRDRLHVHFIGAVGAVFDFYSGSTERSSPWFQAHGLEWLPRLLREPRRLWRRNLISSPAFLTRVLLDRCYGKRQAPKDRKHSPRHTEAPRTRNHEP